ncbi:MAG: hypothetical protein IJY90_01675 [Clostridia bacterium]|nr:hypothetical protein [Clostridia bacterium]
MKFFTADAHFYNWETLKIDNRPFKSPAAFDKFVIKTWNKQAKRGDTIYVIGDFIDCDNEKCTLWKKAITYCKKIKADVVLILGNNEKRVIKHFFNNSFDDFKAFCLSIGFKDVQENLMIEMFGQNFYLTHKPVDYKEGVINLFGHMHRGGGLYKPFGFNIGCDLNHFRLYSERDIKFLLKMKSRYWDKDKNINLK